MLQSITEKFHAAEDLAEKAEITSAMIEHVGLCSSVESSGGRWLGIRMVWVWGGGSRESFFFCFSMFFEVFLFGGLPMTFNKEYDLIDVCVVFGHLKVVLDEHGGLLNHWCAEAGEDLVEAQKAAQQTEEPSGVPACGRLLS